MAYVWDDEAIFETQFSIWSLQQKVAALEESIDSFWLTQFGLWSLEERVELTEALVLDLDNEINGVIVETASTDAIPGGPNLVANSAINSIDSLAHTSTISGGGYENVPQRIGSVAEDETYVPGLARNATISGGYDNMNNQLAGTISGGAHHVLLGAGDHGTIGGGSTNSILAGSYSTIAGGGGAATPQTISGSRSTIGGGGSNNINANFAVIAGGIGNQVDGNGSAIVGGRDNAIYAENAFAVGNNVQISERADSAAALGVNVSTATPGSVNFSARGTFGQSIIFNMGNETVGAQSALLVNSADGATARIPDGSVWSGEAHVVGVNQVGAIVSLSTRFTASAAAIVYSNTTKTVDQIGLAAIPVTLAVDSSEGDFEYTVSGAAGSSINWNGTVVVTQAN